MQKFKKNVEDRLERKETMSHTLMHVWKNVSKSTDVLLELGKVAGGEQAHPKEINYTSTYQQQTENDN